MSYIYLEIYKIAHQLVIEIHQMTIRDLPKFEMYEEGSQIRRSSKSVASNIVEGYGRKRYRNEYIKFLTYAMASNDETLNHLRILFATESLKDKNKYQYLAQKIDLLGRKINLYRKSVENDYQPNT
jgi:four helix bundle protein